MKQLIDIFKKRPILFTIIAAFALLLINHIFFFSGYFGFDDVLYSQLSLDIIRGDFSLIKDPFAYRWTTIFPTALAYLIFGINDFSRAIFPIIASILILTSTLIFLKHKNTSTNILSILLIITSFWFFYYSDKIMADVYVALSFISSISSIYYYKFYKPEQPIKYAILLGLSLFFGFMSKGTIILIIPIIGIVFINDIIKKENTKFWLSSIIASFSFLIIYFLSIELITGSYLTRFNLIEANSYFNQCSYNQLPIINTYKRISFELILNFIETGLFIPIIFGLSLLTKQRIKNIFNTSSKASFIFLISITALLSANFMTISATAYIPMCIDIRHYLFLVAILAISGAYGINSFISENNINISVPILFTITSVLAAFLGYNYYLYFLLGLATTVIIILKPSKKVSLILFSIIMLTVPFKTMINSYTAKWNEHKIQINKIIDTNNKIAIITNDAEKQIINLYSNFDTTRINTFNFSEIDKIQYSNYNKVYWFSYWLTEYYTGFNYFTLPLIIRDKDTTLKYFYKSESLNIVEQNKTIVFYNNFENNIGNWSNNKNRIETQGFSSTLSENISEINLDSLNKFIRVSVNYYSKDTSNAQLVFSIEDNGESIFWAGSKFSDFYSSEKEWNKVVLETKIPNISSGTLKTYVWNSSSDSLLIDNFKLIIF